MPREHDADDIKAIGKVEFEELYKNIILLPKPSSN